MLKEFRGFIGKGNLVDLAVAFILGLAFAALVSAFANVLLSLIAAPFGGDVTFDNLQATVNGTPIPYGALITAIIDFLIIAFALFLIVKGYNQFQDEPNPNTRPCPQCTLEIDREARRCPNCTSEVTPAA